MLRLILPKIEGRSPYPVHELAVFLSDDGALFSGDVRRIEEDRRRDFARGYRKSTFYVERLRPLEEPPHQLRAYPNHDLSDHQYGKLYVNEDGAVWARASLLAGGWSDERTSYGLPFRQVVAAAVARLTA